MTRDELEREVWRTLTAGLGHGERGIDPRTVQAILAAADEYAAHEAERIAHPPYKPALKFDLGHEKAKRARTRSDEKEQRSVSEAALRAAADGKLPPLMRKPSVRPESDYEMELPHG